MTLESVCYGIDLGTTNSCIAIYYKGNRENNPELPPGAPRTTPSVVCFDEVQTLIGSPALKKRSDLPESTFYNVKRLIGRYKNDPRIQKDIKNYTFTVKSDSKQRPKLVIPHSKRFPDGLDIFPEEISALVLDQLAQNASSALAKVPSKPNAVIAVPANFNDYQRRATKDAAKIAGLNPIAVITEPVAACITYAYNSVRKDKPEHVLVYDFGGGTLDVAIVKIEKGVFTVLATAGDTTCGGQDFDRNMREYLIEELEKKGIYFDPDEEKDRNDLALLLSLAEEKKINLSTAGSDTVYFHHSRQDKDVSLTVNRSVMEDFVIRMESKLVNPIEIVLRQANFKAEDIDKVIMVGGSSRIPKVQELVHGHIKQTPSTIVNPDEAIAFGASIYGAYQLGSEIKNLPNLQIQEVTPMSIGINTRNGIDEKIKRNTPKPCSSSYTAYRATNPTGFIQIEVFEGDENDRAPFPVGKFTLKYTPTSNEGVRVWSKISVDMDKITVLGYIGDKEPSEEQERIKEGDAGYIPRLELQTNQSTFSDSEINSMTNEMHLVLKTQEDQSIQKEEYQVILFQFITNLDKLFNKHRDKKKHFNTFSREEKKRIKPLYKEPRKMTQSEYRDSFTRLEEKAQSLLGSDYSRPSGFSPDYTTE